MIELDGAPIGSQSILAERFATFRTVRTGSWLGRAFQRRGFGREMREAVLGFGFDGLGALVAETEAFTDNAASNAVSRSIGYAENGLEQFAPLGVPRDVQRFRMTVEAWRSRPRPPLTIEGLDGCRELFGAYDERRPALEPAGAPAAAARPPPPNPPPPPPPDDDGELPMVPSADIIPPTSGIADPEKRLPPLPLLPRRTDERRPPEVWYQIGK